MGKRNRVLEFSGAKNVSARLGIDSLVYENPAKLPDLKAPRYGPFEGLEKTMVIVFCRRHLCTDALTDF